MFLWVFTAMMMVAFFPIGAVMLIFLIIRTVAQVLNGDLDEKPKEVKPKKIKYKLNMLSEDTINASK